MQILGISNFYPTAPVNAPTSLSAIPTNTNVAISFTAPTNNGGLSITNYEYSFNNSSWTALSPADAASPVTVSGLTQNTAYTIYLRAVNGVGSGPGSTGVSFTTAGVPTGTATITSITSVTQSTATVNFTVASGGGAITGYDLYVTNYTNAWNNTTASPISVTGLTANTTYTFYVRAKNAYGVGPQSAGVSATTLRNLISMDVFVVGGGAGGGGGFYPQGGGGGGGGGAQTTTMVLGAGTYTATVGGGGAAGANAASGPSGAASSFYTLTAGAGLGGATVGYGGNSGNGYAGGANASSTAGGGAGAFGNGGNAVDGNPCQPGNGGTGATNSYRTGNNEQFAGGGGGSVRNQASIVAGYGLGVFGGGNGCQFNLGSGSNATYYGGGGGGGVNYNAASGAAGYQGIVVVRYLTSAASGYTISGGSVNTYGSYTSRTFTGTANLVIS
jgi:hypothetical protein